MLHGPSGELFQEAADGGGDKEDLPCGPVACTPKQGGQQNGPTSVERGERTPHQSRATFEHAKDDKRVDGLEQQAEDGGNEEDDDVLI